MPRRLSVVPLLVVVTLVAWTAVAWAHTPLGIPAETVLDAVELDSTSTTSWQAADAPPMAPWALVVILLAALTAGSRWPRGAFAFAVALCLGVFAFENGVHSVHHLNDDVARASCTIASATAQVAGTVVDPGTTPAVALPLSERLALDRRPNVESHSLAVQQGRAPPLAA